MCLDRIKAADDVGQLKGRKAGVEFRAISGRRGERERERESDTD